MDAQVCTDCYLFIGTDEFHTDLKGAEKERYIRTVRAKMESLHAKGMDLYPNGHDESGQTCKCFVCGTTESGERHYATLVQQ